LKIGLKLLICLLLINVKQMMLNELPHQRSKILGESSVRVRLFELQFLTQKEVSDVNKSLPNRHIAGLDGIPYTVI
jgi:hypothetical protein